MSIHDFPLRPDPMARLAAAVSLAPPPRVGLGAWSPEPVSDLAIFGEAVEAITGRPAGDLAAAMERMLALVSTIPTVEDAAALKRVSAFVDSLKDADREVRGNG